MRWLHGAADRRFPLQRHKLLSNFPDCAARSRSTASIPATSGKGAARPAVRVMIERAIDYGKPVRIGVNWGSLDQDLLASLMDENARRRIRSTRQRHARSADRRPRSAARSSPKRWACPAIASSWRARCRTCRI
jgi:4-hydroxy-3-methylbut-2-en-1-yl diphosphate synthase IspG/GcpE